MKTKMETGSDPVATGDKSQASTKCRVDPESSGSEPETQKNIRAFVSLLTVKVLKKLGLQQNRSLEEWLELIKTLVNDVMDRLNVSKGFSADLKSIKKLCKAVVQHVQKQLHTKRVLEALIALKDPSVDNAIAEAIKTQVEDLSEDQARKASEPQRWWKDFLQVCTMIAGFIGAIALLLLV